MNEIIELISCYSNRSSLLKEERKAAQYIVRKYNEAKNIISDKSNKDAVRIVAEIKGNKKIKDLTDDDYSQLEPYLEKACIVGIARNNLLEIKYLAHALFFLVNDKTEKQILDILLSRSWKFKHEVTIRLAWMRRQKALMLEGNKFNHPFLCNVGSHQNRRNVDREFFSVMTFISLYAKRTRHKYLFHSIPSVSSPSLPRPDFILQDEKGKLLGIEITETNIYADSHFEDESLEKFELALFKVFSKKKLHLVLCSKPKWNLVNKDISTVIKWIEIEETKAQEFLKEKGTHDISNEFYNINLRFKKYPDFYTFSYAGREIGGTEVEKKLGISIKERIEKKLKLEKPEIRPCYLVIYIRTSIPSMHTKIVKKYAQKGLGNKFKLHFDQIWAVKEQRLLRIA